MFDSLKEKSTSWKVGFIIAVFCSFLSLFPIMALVYRWFGLTVFIVALLFVATAISALSTVLPLFFSKRFAEMDKEKRILLAVGIFCANLAIYPLIIVCYRLFGSIVAIATALTIAVFLSIGKKLVFGLLISERVGSSDKEKQKEKQK